MARITGCGFDWPLLEAAPVDAVWAAADATDLGARWGARRFGLDLAGFFKLVSLASNQGDARLRCLVDSVPGRATLCKRRHL